MTAYYKVLGPDLKSYHGGTGTWTVGKWRSVRGPLVPCENGLQFVRADQLRGWLGPVICPFDAAAERKWQTERLCEYLEIQP